MSTNALGGILLTGGASTRMGRDKATLRIAGTTLAERSARILRATVDLSVEVGIGCSGLTSVREEPSGEGPLAAIVAGYAALDEMGLDPESPCLVIACDLPLLEQWVLERIAHWPGDESVVPLIGKIAQPLCARWSARDLNAARLAFARHERSLRAVPDRRRAVLVDERAWAASAAVFSDVDTPEDMERLGLVEHTEGPSDPDASFGVDPRQRPDD